MRQLRQPRLAEIVAASLRDDILGGHLKEGDSLPTQEHLLEEFRVSSPALREAMRILETEGLVSVRRGNVGGAVVHEPSAQRTARMISLVLQSKGTSLGDVSWALLHIEPVCTSLCAEREDRAEAVVPRLREIIQAQKDNLDDASAYTASSRQFHELLVESCGNKTLQVVLGSLESIWTAHEHSAWTKATMHSPQQPDPDHPEVKAMRRRALRDHEKIVDAIEAGDQERATSLASRHLAATRTSTLSSASHEYVVANMLDEVVPNR